MYDARRKIAVEQSQINVIIQLSTTAISYFFSSLICTASTRRERPFVPAIAPFSTHGCHPILWTCVR